ncbi:hypothetical protein TorRG33x02_126200 [Trema orientale]|uniref:Transmembrane protein n=1 Tax=Trema orientale TaxID=63057 RepID=A0A2P5F1C1_TREOI|nr:hypothetical protein TorRG33x02_126200 [Trema orientale]
MAMKMKIIKPSNEGVVGNWAKTEPSYKEVVQTGAEPSGYYLGPKKGSVIPARRRLVKKMVFDWLVKSIASAFLACFGFVSSFHVFRRSRKVTTTGTTVPKNTNKNTKNDVVFPEP